MPKDTARLVLVVEDDDSVRRPLVKFLELHRRLIEKPSSLMLLVETVEEMLAEAKHST